MNILFQRKILGPRTREQAEAGYKDTYEIIIPEHYKIENNELLIRPARQVVISEGEVIDGSLLTSSKVRRGENGKVTGVEDYFIKLRPHTVMTSRSVTLEIPEHYEVVGPVLG